MTSPSGRCVPRHLRHVRQGLQLCILLSGVSFIFIVIPVLSPVVDQGHSEGSEPPGYPAGREDYPAGREGQPEGREASNDVIVLQYPRQVKAFVAGADYDVGAREALLKNVAVYHRSRDQHSRRGGKPNKKDVVADHVGYNKNEIRSHSLANGGSLLFVPELQVAAQTRRPATIPAMRNRPSTTMESTHDGPSSTMKVMHGWLLPVETVKQTALTPAPNGNNDTVRNNSTGLSATPNIAIPPEFVLWAASKTKHCGDNMTLYASLFARLRGMVIDPKFCMARAKGGEAIDRVLKQDENAEYYTHTRGCFQLNCPLKPHYRFAGSSNYLNDWIGTLTTSNLSAEGAEINSRFTIALMRRDYANLYWTMNDWYTTYLMMRFFNKTADETDVLLVDAHPMSILDPAWSTLFGSCTRFSSLSRKIQYTDLVWGTQGYNSLLRGFLPKGHYPPHFEDFKDFFLSRFHLNAPRALNCSRLSVLIVWRRDYVAHPRNPKGIVQRKFANEQELLDGMRRLHPTYDIQGVQLDQLSMAEQLELVRKADILVGMHGAGLAHAVMLQPHAGMIEIVPSYSDANNNHFADMTRWQHISYIKWINSDHRLERPNFQTYIPVTVMDEVVKLIADHQCNGSRARMVAVPLYMDRIGNRVSPLHYQSYRQKRMQNLKNPPLQNLPGVQWQQGLTEGRNVGVGGGNNRNSKSGRTDFEVKMLAPPR